MESLETCKKFVKTSLISKACHAYELGKVAFDTSDALRYNVVVHLSVFRDQPSGSTDKLFQRFTDERVLERLRQIDTLAREGGLAALDPRSDPLIGIGAEVDSTGSVTKNSYGVLNLSWRAREHPEWAEQITGETQEIRQRIRDVHQVSLRFLIWAGMGGSVEDKTAYNAAGLLRRSPLCYSLDSTDPAKLKSILEVMAERTGERLPTLLKSTLVVGMAMGMTSYEPVVNLTKLANLYEKFRIDSRPNFVYMTLPGSLLDQFASARGYRRIELQPDGCNSTAGRHSAPLTRGSLYPLALCGVDLKSWIADTFLSDEEIHLAWRLSAFVEAHGRAGRDKITLMLPKQWAGAGLWTKQNFEESLGKSEEIGLKIVIGEKIRLANYRSPKDDLQDRAFLAVQVKGVANDDAEKITLLRRAGYPLAILTLPKSAQLSRYMQFIHYAVCGVGYLRRMNFVTQPSVELYKAIAGQVDQEAREQGGVERTSRWQAMISSPRKAPWRGGLTLFHEGLEAEGSDAVSRYVAMLTRLTRSRQVEYGELTFFGDMRYSVGGHQMRKSLDRAGERVFRIGLKMPVDVYEGPAMNHSYHEMIIGHGRCFSTILFCEKQDQLSSARYDAGYHLAQFLATKLALEQRQRAVVALLLKDLSTKSIDALDEFFDQVAARLQSRST